ncbi:MAG: Fe-S cluster assembly protein SufD [Propionibacteriaceae bacterium]|jgi:Fe-S cluster assembly protein SufD|nr:Fe-S cluster assembly protein SufD [Propionibacteriaceae bacterium]
MPEVTLPGDLRTQSHLHPAGSFDLADHPVPTGREEVWRFTPLRRVEAILNATAITDGTGLQVTVGAAPDLIGPPLQAGQAPRGTALTPSDRVAALAHAAARHPLYIRIPEGRAVADPVRIDLHGIAPEELTAYHLVIAAGAHSAATVVLHHTGAAQCLGNVEAVVGDGAKLSVVTLQDWDATAVHLGQHEAKVGRDAEYRHIAVSLGGDLIRLQNNVSYAGVGGSAELFGVYFVDGGQHIEHRIFVDHNNPKGKSLVDYRGALQGKGARSVWIGDVLIRPEAEGIETYESNKNLVLTDGCRADAVPNLEIETGEIVGAGHSASTGRFDDEQLFYLRSRGIDEAEARRLVVRGFFAQLVGRIGLADVEDALMTTIDRELAAATPERTHA